MSDSAEVYRPNLIVSNSLKIVKFGTCTSERKLYPTRNGLPIRIEELGLPETELDIMDPNNFSNHHSCFTGKTFSSVLLQTLRDLESRQSVQPIDTHKLIHRKYDGPIPPTPLLALTEIERARDAGERLKVPSPKGEKGSYTCREITDKDIQDCIESYNSLKRQLN